MAGYFCPMHASVHSSERGSCPVCGMALVRADSRFPLLHHVFTDPLHLAAMVLLLALLMGVAMVLH